MIRDYVDIANEYAERVLRGTVPACEYVKQAARRHLDDLAAASGGDDFPFVFDETAAIVACRIIELMPFTKGKWAREGRTIRMSDWQVFITACVFGWKRASDGLRRYRIAYVEVPRKNGKALALDTPIPTPGGWTTMGEIKPGDYVFDDEGQPTRVTRATDVMHGHDCYRVTFSDGAEIIADAEHLWAVQSRRTGRPGGAETAGMTMDEIRRPNELIRTTRELAENVEIDRRGRTERNHRVRLAGPLRLPEADLPIHPYGFGCWLGDGSSTNALITCSYDDLDLIDEIRRCGVDANETSTSNENSGAFYLTTPGHVHSKKHSVRGKLRALGVWGNKHIPAPYLRASEAQRLALLQGLMDTDGYASKAGQCEFTTTSPALRDGFLELALSLGYKPSVKTARATIDGKDCGEKYRVQFWAYRERPAFRRARKAERLKPTPARPTRSSYRHIVSIEPVESVPVRCITVDAPSSLFLCGREMIPTHNSEWSAAVALYMFAADGEHGAEVYSGATTEKQAKIVFTAAQRMARKTEAFREAFGVEVMASNLSIPENGSKFEPLIGKPGDGASPSCAIVDEYHEHATDHLYDSMETGMGAREQPLMWVITTAGSDISGPCYELRSDVIRTLEGTLKNDELFGIIYTIDKDDDWTSEEALIKANPNIGVSVDGDYLRRQIRDAVANSRRQNITKTKHLNVWVQAREAWMNMEAWNRQAREMTEDEFAGEPCWMGLDLASKIDIASAVKVFRRGEEWFVFGRHYLPEDRIEDVENRHYQKWLTDGHLQGTEGDIIDHDANEADIAADADRHKLLTVGYDPYNATQLAVNLTRRRIETLEIRQTAKFLSDPMKWIEALVLAGNLWHDGNAAMTWMMSNVVARVDANDNVFPRKERAENKIDGPVALIIAMNVAMRQEGAGPSVYQSRRIRTL